MSSSTKWLYGAQVDDMTPLSLHAIAAVVAVHDGQVLLQKGAYPGLEKWWCLPEDNLRFGENPEDCARRVLHEQAHVEATRLRLLYVQSSVYKDVHWDLWFMYAATVEGEPSPGTGKWEVSYFAVDRLPENVHPQDKPDIEQVTQ